ncbi:MAG: hypothetical protein JJT78_00090 [Leptospira sp.]|nr:hypothetical protein [Leptospira sp.]
MNLTNGMKLLLERVTGEEKITEDTFYKVAQSLDVLEPMVQSSEKKGKFPTGSHNLELEDDLYLDLSKF